MEVRDEAKLITLLDHPGWPLMDELIFGEAKTLLQMSFVVKKDCSAGVQAMLKKLSLDVPESQEEQLRTYLAIRAVLGYLTNKREKIEILKMNYQEKMRKGDTNSQGTPRPPTTLRGS